jgi:hypothetical protein
VCYHKVIQEVLAECDVKSSEVFAQFRGKLSERLNAFKERRFVLCANGWGDQDALLHKLWVTAQTDPSKKGDFDILESEQQHLTLTLLPNLEEAVRNADAIVRGHLDVVADRERVETEIKRKMEKESAEVLAEKERVEAEARTKALADTIAPAFTSTVAPIPPKKLDPLTELAKMTPPPLGHSALKKSVSNRSFFGEGSSSSRWQNPFVLAGITGACLVTVAAMTNRRGK